jgi:hypothetical protein
MMCSINSFTVSVGESVDSSGGGEGFAAAAAGAGAGDEELQCAANAPANTTDAMATTALPLLRTTVFLSTWRV